jgi:hypothetical protein
MTTPVAVPAAELDRRALDAIALILQDPQYSPAMLEDIAGLVRGTGRDLTGNGTPTWGRH